MFVSFLTTSKSWGNAAFVGPYLEMFYFSVNRLYFTNVRFSSKFVVFDDCAAICAKYSWAIDNFDRVKISHITKHSFVWLCICVTIHAELLSMKMEINQITISPPRHLESEIHTIIELLAWLGCVGFYAALTVSLRNFIAFFPMDQVEGLYSKHIYIEVHIKHTNHRLISYVRSIQNFSRSVPTWTPLQINMNFNFWRQ